jgi:hypothetical protein
MLCTHQNVPESMLGTEGSGSTSMNIPFERSLRQTRCLAATLAVSGMVTPPLP